MSDIENTHSNSEKSEVNIKYIENMGLFLLIMFSPFILLAIWFFVVLLIVKMNQITEYSDTGAVLIYLFPLLLSFVLFLLIQFYLLKHHIKDGKAVFYENEIEIFLINKSISVKCSKLEEVKIHRYSSPRSLKLIRRYIFLSKEQSASLVTWEPDGRFEIMIADKLRDKLRGSFSLTNLIFKFFNK